MVSPPTAAEFFLQFRHRRRDFLPQLFNDRLGRACGSEQAQPCIYR